MMTVSCEFCKKVKCNDPDRTTFCLNKVKKKKKKLTMNLRQVTIHNINLIV